MENIATSQNKNEAILFQQTISLQSLIRRKAFVDHLMKHNSGTSKTIFDHLMNLIGSNKVTVEHKIKLIDIISVAAQFDRYQFLPHTTQILNHSLEMMLSVGKDEGDSQIEMISHVLDVRYSNTYSIMDFKLVS